MVRHRFRLKHSWSLIVLTVFLVSFFLLLPTHVLFSNYKQAMLEEMGKRALAVANTTATLLAMETLPYIELTRAIQEDPNTIDQKQYDSMHTLFIKLREDASVDYLYTQYKLDNTTCIFVVDSQDQGNPLYSFSPLGTQESMLSSGCDEVFQNAISVTTGVIEHERWGTSIFAHAPIIDNADGKVLGVVCTGFSIATLEGNMHRPLFKWCLWKFFL